MMQQKRFIVTIEESITNEYTITANSVEEAEAIATIEYENGKFNRTDEQLKGIQMETYNATDKTWTDWHEF